MSAHTHTHLVPGCWRCDLNRDELDAWREQARDVADDLRSICARIYNGAPDPWQAVYNTGWHPALEALAEYLTNPHGRNCPSAPTAPPSARTHLKERDHD